MLNQSSVYRNSQILTATPLERVVLLYRGALRFAARQVQAADQGDREASHVASLRAQEIVSALRETLDLSAGGVANQLDGLYDFCLRRLMDGNIRMDPRPVHEAIDVLTRLLEAWVAIGSESSATASLAAAVPAAGTAAAQPVGHGRAAMAYGATR